MSDEVPAVAEPLPVAGHPPAADGDEGGAPRSDPSTGLTMARLSDLSDSPLVTGGVLLLVGVCFVAARLILVAHGHISFFVIAGSQFVNPAQAPHGLVIMKGQGYDGQFYYRLALAPWKLGPTAYGITIDSTLRDGRIGYPVLAWLASFGQRALVPYSLVAVNVVALAFTGFFSGKWAHSFGRHALWGLLPAGYFGLEYSLSRDLTEITSIALVIGGIVAWRRGHAILAGLSFGGAVLCRETALVVVAALLVTRVFEVVRRHQRIGRDDAAWAIPLVAYGAWEVVVRIATGAYPVRTGRGNIGVPFAGLFHAARYWVEHPHRAELIQLLQLAVLLTVVVLALVNLRRSQASSFERLAFLFALVLTVSLSTSVWNNDPREFRTMIELFVLGSGILLGTRAFRPLVVTGMTWGLWVVVAGLTLRAA